MTPSSWNSSRARNTVARPMPGRSAWASATRSAAVKWPERRSTSSATARRGSVRRCPEASRVRRIGAVRHARDDTQSHVAGQGAGRRAGQPRARCPRHRDDGRSCRAAWPTGGRPTGRSARSMGRLPLTVCQSATASLPSAFAFATLDRSGGLPWTADRPLPRRAARNAAPAASPNAKPTASAPGARQPGRPGRTRRRSSRARRSSSASSSSSSSSFGPGSSTGGPTSSDNPFGLVKPGVVDPGRAGRRASPRQGRCAGHGGRVGGLPVPLLRPVRPDRRAAGHHEPRGEGDGPARRP